MEILPLAMMKAGETGKILRITEMNGLAEHLAAMGVCRGTDIEILQPGHNCIIKAGDTRLALRCDEGLKIFIEKDLATPVAAVLTVVGCEL